MTDLPKRIEIHEEGPREGFQIEAGPISTADKVRFCEALAETGLHDVQCVSFVDARRVPGMADAVEVAQTIRQRPDVQYTGIALNLRGYERAVQTPLHITGGIQMSTSNTFSIHNTNKNNEETLVEQGRQLDFFKARGIAVESAIVMTAFGCNFEGEIAPETVRDCVGKLLDLADAYDITLDRVRIADTVGWASPASVQRVVGTIREKWPDLKLGLHLHDTRGTGMANALMGMQMGIASFDSSCAGLGGCPFAGHKGAAGNICTEDLVFMAHEMGIETGIDLDALIECARMAEDIVGHPLPGKVMHGGSLSKYRVGSPGMTEVLVEKRGAVQWITINREERRNAMNDTVVFGIMDGLTAATSDPDIRAVVLTGAGDRAFCAGADLAAGSGSFKYDYSKVGIPFVKLMRQARDLTVPLIARVNGHTMAGGMGMMGMCDMAIAVDNARFGMPEVKVGIFPMQIMAVLQRLIPNRKLYEMALTGEPITATEALQLGLVNYVVPAAELDTKLNWLLDRLLDKSPTAIRRGKYAMRQTESMSFDQSAVFMEAQIGTLALTEDAAEGRQAFIEKRSPAWTGR